MNKLDRRQFLRSIAKPAAAASVVLSSPSLMARALDSVKGITGDPKVIARDERYWREIQQAYSADRGIVNLNNGGIWMIDRSKEPNFNSLEESKQIQIKKLARN